jgi:hypothetical protein
MTVARWRGKVPQRVEPPEWYRNYHPEAWDEPDAQERAMMAGWNIGPWPEWLHDHHSRRRWGEAKYAYRQAHPLLGEQELRDIFDRRATRRDIADS